MTVGVVDQMSVFADPEWRTELGLLAESTRILARGYAADAFLLVSLAARVPEPVGTADGAVPWQSFVREVAIARGVQERAATHELALADVLVRSMPRTLELLACGSVTVNRAVALMEELLVVDPDIAHAVDRALSRRLADMTPERIRRAARREIDRLDADAAAERAAKATASRGVRITSERDGQACGYLTGPAIPLTRWYQALTEAALAQQRAGDPRALDALRFDLLVAGFTADSDAPTPRPAGAPVPPPLPHTDPTPVPDALLSPAERAEGGKAVTCAADAADPADPGPDHAALAPFKPPPGTGAPATVDPPPGPERPGVPPPAGAPPGTGPTDQADFQALLDGARAQAARLLLQARAQAERVLDAAHHAEADALDRVLAARAEADRLTAQALRDRLTASTLTPDDRRRARPVQLLVHVPVTTLLGLHDEPGWLEGYGWISAPQCRQLLPVAELRQVCVTTAGQVIDLASAPVRPEPTPAGARQALLDLATEPFDISDHAWHTTDQHDPPAALGDLVRLRDRYCDGPLGTLVPATRCDLDHNRSWPDGPTAAWNLVARSRRSHRLKHRQWVPVRTSQATMWTTPAGQLVQTPHHQHAAPVIDHDARLPDADALHDLENRLLQPPDDDAPC